MEENQIESLARQNELLKIQNDLLREQNEMLRHSLPNLQSDERKIFIKNIDRDEIRSGFLVTSHKKKLWNVQIGLIKEFARICAKHNLRWFAIGGTLLGAARHGGFIPWDDDVDVIMFRPDYNKFQSIAAQEIESPYFLDIWWNYRLESEGASLSEEEGVFQFITKEQEKMRGERWLTQWPSIRIRDSRTMMIEFPERNFTNQGIWIDIFPLDSLPPFAEKKQQIFFEVARAMLLATAAPSRMREIMKAKEELFMNYADLEEFLSYPYKERGQIFDYFMNKHFSLSERVGDIRDYCLTAQRKFYHSKDFADVIYLPFEGIEVPAPSGYDSLLTDFYGDWRTPVCTHNHSMLYSADISYKGYFE